MELISKELTIIEDALKLLIENHKEEIKEIKQSECAIYEKRVQRMEFANQFLVNPLTADDLREKDIKEERDSIADISELHRKLFLSNNQLLVVSKRIQLVLSRATTV